MGAGLAAGLTWVASLALAGADVVVSLGNAVFAMVVLAVASLVGLILGLTGAVPTAKVLGASLKESTKSNGTASSVAKTPAASPNHEVDDPAGPNEGGAAPRMQTPGTAASASPRKVTGGDDEAVDPGEDNPGL